MLYVRGSTGTALVQVRHDLVNDTLVCTVLNDSSTVTIDRSTNATLVAGVHALEVKIGSLVGAPAIVSDLPEIL